MSKLFWHLISCQINNRKQIRDAIDKILKSGLIFDEIDSNARKLTNHPNLVQTYRKNFVFKPNELIIYITGVDKQYATFDYLKANDLLPEPEFCFDPNFNSGATDRKTIFVEKKPDIIFAMILKHFEDENRAEFQKILNYVDGSKSILSAHYFDVLMYILFPIALFNKISVNFIICALNICQEHCGATYFEEYSPGRTKILDMFFSTKCDKTVVDFVKQICIQKKPTKLEDKPITNITDIIKYVLSESAHIEIDTDYYFSLAAENLLPTINNAVEHPNAETDPMMCCLEFFLKTLPLTDSNVKFLTMLNCNNIQCYKHIAKVLIDNGSWNSTIELDLITSCIINCRLSVGDIEDMVSIGVNCVTVTESLCCISFSSKIITNGKHLWEYYTKFMDELPEGNPLTLCMMCMIIDRKDLVVSLLNLGFVFDETECKKFCPNSFLLENFSPEILEYASHFHTDITKFKYSGIDLPVVFVDGVPSKGTVDVLFYVTLFYGNSLNVFKTVLKSNNFCDWQKLLNIACDRYIYYAPRMNFYIINYIIEQGADPYECLESFKQMLELCADVLFNKDDNVSVNTYTSWLQLANITMADIYEKRITLCKKNNEPIQITGSTIMSSLEKGEEFLKSLGKTSHRNDTIVHEFAFRIYRKHDFSKLKQYVQSLIDAGTYKQGYNSFIFTEGEPGRQMLSRNQIDELISCGLDTSTDLLRCLTQNTIHKLEENYVQYLLDKEFELN
jgi:hypothetical protein